MKKLLALVLSCFFVLAGCAGKSASSKVESTAASNVSSANSIPAKSETANDSSLPQAGGNDETHIVFHDISIKLNQPVEVTQEEKRVIIKTDTNGQFLIINRINFIENADEEFLKETLETAAKNTFSELPIEDIDESYGKLDGMDVYTLTGTMEKDGKTVVMSSLSFVKGEGLYVWLSYHDLTEESNIMFEAIETLE